MMTEEQTKSFEEAVKPLIKWLCNNRNPHTYVMVTNAGSEIVEGIHVFETEEFLND
jgi:hypothetical protein